MPEVRSDVKDVKDVKNEKKPDKKGILGKMKEAASDKEEQLDILSTFVRLGILVWSGGILTLAYIQLPPVLGIPEQKLDPTFIASVFTGVLATFGVQAAKKNGNGNSNGSSAGGGITKEDMERLIAAATHPTYGILVNHGAAAAPTLAPTILPVDSPPPSAFIHSNFFAVNFPSAPPPIWRAPSIVYSSSYSTFDFPPIPKKPLVLSTLLLTPMTLGSFDE